MIEDAAVAGVHDRALADVTDPPPPRAEIEAAIGPWYAAVGLPAPAHVLWASSPPKAEQLLHALRVASRASDRADTIAFVAVHDAVARAFPRLPGARVTEIAGLFAGDGADPLAPIAGLHTSALDAVASHARVRFGAAAVRRIETAQARRLATVRTAIHDTAFAGLGAALTEDRLLPRREPLSAEGLKLFAEHGLPAARAWTAWATIASGTLACWAFHGCVVVCERPRTVRVDALGRPHGEAGPALEWSDGHTVFAWHGTRVPESLIVTPWPGRIILRERNIEVRRCAIERLGWERFVADVGLQQVGPTVPDPANPGHTLRLYDVPRGIAGEAFRVLLCTNATTERDGTRRRYGLIVPVSLSDPLAAAAWSFGLPAAHYRALAAAS